MRHSKKALQVKILVIGVAIILGIFGMQRGVSLDEALSIYSARQPLNELLSFTLRAADAQPPAYAFLLHFLLKISSSIMWLRAFSLLCGLLTIFMLYKLAVPIFGDFIAALACSLIALSKFFIFHSTEVRCYSIWILCSIASVYFFLKLVKSFSSKNIFLYIFFTTASIYFHYFGLGILLIEIIFFFFYKNYLKLRSKNWYAIWAFIVFLLIPQIIHAFLKFKKFHVWGEYFKGSGLTFETLVMLPNEYFGQIVISGVFIIVVIAAFMYKLLNILSRGDILRQIKSMPAYFRNNYKAVFLLSLFFLAVFLNFFINIFNFQNYAFSEPRYLAPFMLMGFFIIGWSVSSSGKIKNYLALFLIAITLLYTVRTFTLLYKQPSPKIAAASNFLKTRLQDDDVVSVLRVDKFLNIFNYLKRPLVIIVRAEDIQKYYFLRILELKKNEVITGLDSLANKKRLWIVAESGSENDADWFTENKHLKLSLNEYVDGINIRLYLING